MCGRSKALSLSGRTLPLAIQIRLSVVLSFSFFFLESSTFFHRFAILLATSFLPFFEGVAGVEEAIFSLSSFAS